MRELDREAFRLYALECAVTDGCANSFDMVIDQGRKEFVDREHFRVSAGLVPMPVSQNDVMKSS